MLQTPLPKEVETLELRLRRVLKDHKGISHYKLLLSVNGEDNDCYQIITTFNENDKFSKNYTQVQIRESDEDLSEEVYKY